MERKSNFPEKTGDILSAGEIETLIKTDGVFRVEVRRKVTSTNDLLRELADAGAPEGYVLAAEEQTAGKGRQGRGFHSPAGHGVYFSLLLRPGFAAKDTALITPAASVAAALAIGEVYGVRAGIKWVNDLLVDGKKVCGILTGTVLDAESGLVESAVLGIGINVTPPEAGYPEGIRAVAGALTDFSGGVEDRRCRLIAAILDNFWGYYGETGREAAPCPAPRLAQRAFLEEYRARSVVLGQKIYVITGEGRREARAIAIDDDCGLVVEYDDGSGDGDYETATLNSGEVSIRAIGNNDL